MELNKEVVEQSENKNQDKSISRKQVAKTGKKLIYYKKGITGIELGGSWMIVYHGSDTIVDVPRIIEAKRSLDFGGGFYVTTSEEQARKWATKVAYRNANKHSYINKYELDMEHAKKETQVVCFEHADEE